ncbi:MAG: PEP/pyruvate-binding domain-containing protein [Roseiflexaceae bacterium]
MARCRRSAWSVQATAYRQQHGQDADAPRVAVLVQQLVVADASAVAFSIDPVSGDRDRIVVNATWGLGESLVGGLVTPDSYTLRKADAQIVARQIADKTQMSVPTAGGTQLVAVPAERRRLPALSDAQVAEVAQLARALEQRMGWPVDIECAYAGARLALLQCRPVTVVAAGASAIAWATPDDATLTWRWGRQAFPGPLTPLMQSYLPFHTQGWVHDSRAQCTVGEIRIRFEQGYYYSRWQPTGLTTWEEADLRALEAERATPARWRDEFLPLLRADHQRVRALDRAAFETLLATALANYPLTEDHNFWIDQQCPADLRLLCAEIGRRMAQRGTLDAADDIAFLTLSELVLWGFGLADPLLARVAQHKAEYEAQRRITPPDYLGAPPESQPWIDRFGGPPVPLDAEPGAVQGVGASAGRVVGTVRVARTFDEAQALERGEVLVCPATDPNWAPLFGIASALVTDTGGSLCHAAVLAREYHLPAVVGTHTATAQLQTGQRVEVDGLSGRIRLLNREP